VRKREQYARAREGIIYITLKKNKLNNNLLKIKNVKLLNKINMKESTFKKYKLVVDEWFVNGFNGTKAYQKFYPKASDEVGANMFSEIVRIHEVSEYIETKENTISKTHNITLDGQIKVLQDIIKDKGCSNRDKISAIQEQNKLVALYEDHNKQKIPQQEKMINLSIDGKSIVLK